jgi:hypothetical protein
MVSPQDRRTRLGTLPGCTQCDCTGARSIFIDTGCITAVLLTRECILQHEANLQSGRTGVPPTTAGALIVGKRVALAQHDETSHLIGPEFTHTFLDISTRSVGQPADWLSNWSRCSSRLGVLLCCVEQRDPPTHLSRVPPL